MLFLIRPSNCSLQKMSNTKIGLIQVKPDGKPNFRYNKSRYKKSTAIEIIVKRMGSTNEVVKKSLKVFLSNLKKSVLVDCTRPIEIKGTKKTSELLNKLNTPLSAGVK